MNKLLLIITLFVSSFFIFYEDVKADDVYVITYEETILDNINEEFFMVRDLVINYAKENSFNYFIIKRGTSYYTYFTNNSVTSFISTGRSWFENNNILFSYYTISSSNNYSFDLLGDGVTLSHSSNKNYEILDSNIDIYYDPYSIQINYMNNSYLVDSVNKMPTLYDIYVDVNNITPTNPHQEELEKLENFYIIVIEKLGYLAEIIISNYILLSIIVIFILIFIFKLIFRRFL